MKKYYHTIMILTVSLCLLGGCARTADKSFTEVTTENISEETVKSVPDPTELPLESTTEPVETASEETVQASVRFDHYVMGDGEFADVLCFADDGELIWTHLSTQYKEAPFDGCKLEEIGRYGDRYYYRDNDRFIGLDMQTGQVLWQEPEMPKDPAAVNVPLDQEMPAGEVVNVRLDWFLGDTSHGNIIGVNIAGNPVWVNVSKEYTLHPQVQQLTAIGIDNGRYYYTDEGAVVALDLQTGKELWRNTDGFIYAECFCFGPDGTLYAGCRMGTAFLAVDKDGRTVAIIDECPEDVVQPAKFQMVGSSIVEIIYEYSFADWEHSQVYHVDPTVCKWIYQSAIEPIECEMWD